MRATTVTAQGQATRERIVRAAAELISERGAGGTSLDVVMAASAVSKSQLYHYFGNKRGLVEAVVDYQCGSVLAFQADALDAVSDWDSLERWAATMVAGVEARAGRGGCPIGTLAAALADSDESLRTSLNLAFQAWSDALHGALVRLRDNGLIVAGSDLDRLTTIMLAAIEGGLLLAKTSRDPRQLRIALDGAIDRLRAHAPTPTPTPARRRR